MHEFHSFVLRKEGATVDNQGNLVVFFLDVMV